MLYFFLKVEKSVADVFCHKLGCQSSVFCCDGFCYAAVFLDGLNGTTRYLE